ncbi:helix-turn-helix domain-containing protein [Leuconostoc pseudomesenteroides]|uniref:helix-turn-helix domain-containing protein n=1 Tax=Leuconostoc pseudomesenteroides TaxID=33968 RepID=UPI0011236253|nr:helix-turn-helix transcriptional regulator [Leuconostoc pseudomesenteroides]MCT4379853.1 XRE family transcriptional regulator [Leuconostoc pseudomesenteroides]TOZ07369.1 XRE family transcriptional regulator [Leuconostoc pseudomesenteroides]
MKSTITINQIADVLRNKRIQKGYTIEHLSELSDVSIGSISGIENKKQSNISVITLLNLMYALGIEGDEIFGSSNTKINQLIRDNQELKQTLRQIIDCAKTGLSD